MNTLKALAASALLIAAGSAFASYDDGQPDNAWLMQPAATQVVQAPAPAPAPAAAAAQSGNDKAATAPRATREDADIMLP